MRVFHVSTGGVKIPDDRLGGIEGHIFVTSKKLVSMGHQVTILDRKYAKSDPFVAEAAGVKVLRFRSVHFPQLPLEKLRAFKFVYVVRSFLINNMLFTLRCIRYLNENTDFDVLNVYTFYSAVVTSVFLKKSMRSRVYYTHMSSLWPREEGGFLETRFLPFFARIVIRRIGGVIVQNPEYMRIFTKKLGLQEGLVFLIPSGTETGMFAKRLDIEPLASKYPYIVNKRVVLFTGRINRVKGVDLLVKAVGILAKNGGLEDCVFVCVGPYEEFDVNKPQGFSTHVLGMVKDLGLEEYIKFTGTIPLADLKAFYQMCTVFVLPSRFENCAAVINEAMANGKPIVASKTGGSLVQVKDGWNGILVEVDNETAVAGAIKRILEHPSEAERMGKNSKAFSSDFDWQRIAEKYVLAYQGSN